MAAINPRLLPLLETLIGVGAEWLAAELLEGIQSGRYPEETPEMLEMTRERVRVRSKGDFDLSEERPYPLTESRPIPMDEQVEWAANYIAERLETTLDNFAASLENLAVIASTSPNQTSVSTRNESEVSVVFGTGDQATKLSPRLVAKAQKDMGRLREALNRWSIQEGGGKLT